MDNRLNYYVEALLNYGRREGLLLSEGDVIYSRNRLLALLQEDGDEYTGKLRPEEETEIADLQLVDILQGLLLEADIKNLVDGTSIAACDLFDSRLMDCLLPRPSEVEAKFRLLQQQSPKAATDYFYHLSQASDYIRTYRVCKDEKWQTATDYGMLDITINLSKPEKDPRAIKAAATLKSGTYPQCVLCKEAMGYKGRLNYPGRSNHRIIPLTLAGEDWYLQYSPYVYYNEHCIVLSATHRKMAVTAPTFERLLEFVRQFPHYCLGSNADLPIVGGSILSHDHFQGGAYVFPMQKAQVLFSLPPLPDFPQVQVDYLNWPLSVLRLRSAAAEALVGAADKILQAWRTYSDPTCAILAQSTVDGKEENHNTITPISRNLGQEYELALVLRNNRTSPEYPLGIFHPHADKHHIKKENIGLIEVMGLAVLPARLQSELQALQQELIKGKTGENNAALQIHSSWAGDLLKRYGAAAFRGEEGQALLRRAVGEVFASCLEDAGVYKLDEAGIAGVKRFYASL